MTEQIHQKILISLSLDETQRLTRLSERPAQKKPITKTNVVRAALLALESMPQEKRAEFFDEAERNAIKTGRRW